MAYVTSFQIVRALDSRVHADYNSVGVCDLELPKISHSVLVFITLLSLGYVYCIMIQPR
jgi:hypothetical protein